MLKVTALQNTDERVWSCSQILREMARVVSGTAPGTSDRAIAVVDMLAPKNYAIVRHTTAPDTATAIRGLTAIAPPGKADSRYMMPNSPREAPSNALELASESRDFFRSGGHLNGAPKGWLDYTPQPILRGQYYGEARTNAWLAVKTPGVRPFDDFMVSLDLSKPSEIVREVLPLFLIEGEFPSALGRSPVSLGQHMLEGGHTNAVVIVDRATWSSFDLKPDDMPIHYAQRTASEIAALVTAHWDPDRYDAPEGLHVKGSLIYSQRSGLKALSSGLIGDWQDRKVHEPLNQDTLRELIRFQAPFTFCVVVDSPDPVCALLINEIPGATGGLYGLS